MVSEARRRNGGGEVILRNLLEAIFDIFVVFECANANSSCATAAPAEWPVNNKVTGSYVSGLDCRMTCSAVASILLATSRKPRWQTLCSPS